MKENWLNNGPRDLIRDLPKGWEERTVPHFEGKALVLRPLGRLELLMTKLFAYCDRQEDFRDCVAMKPTPEELRASEAWLEERDLNPLWPDHVRVSLAAIAREVGCAYP